ncbi:hypothetical protein D9M68_448960 [compost metagenome]
MPWQLVRVLRIAQHEASRILADKVAQLLLVRFFSPASATAAPRSGRWFFAMAIANESADRGKKLSVH